VTPHVRQCRARLRRIAKIGNDVIVARQRESVQASRLSNLFKQSFADDAASAGDECNISQDDSPMMGRDRRCHDGRVRGDHGVPDGPLRPTPLQPSPDDPAFATYQQFLHMGEAGSATLIMVPLVSGFIAPEVERGNWSAR
jgi:hypothetical protein